MKLTKRGQSGVAGTTVALITGVITVVILFAAAPELYTVLDSALDDTATAGIPLLSGMTGIIALLFGAVVLLGGLFVLMKQIRSR